MEAQLASIMLCISEQSDDRKCAVYSYVSVKLQFMSDLF
jgi:hypothetical protein